MTDLPVEPVTNERPRLIALIVSSAMFMAQLDSTIVVTALPRMAQTFHVPVVDMSISITIYMLVQAALLPASSWIADRLGARTVFAAAMLGFVLTSAMCAFCHDLTQFICARVLQGASAALMAPVGRMVMLRAVKKSDLISTMAIASVPMLVAPTIGPPLGGFITTYFDWPWVFLLNVPVGCAGIWLILRYIPDIKTTERQSFDFFGFLLFGSSLSFFLYGLDWIGDARDVRWPLALLAAGTGVFFIALRHIRRHPEGLISLSPFRHPTFRINIVGGGLLARLPVRAAPFVLPLMFQIGMGMSAFESGFFLMFLNGGDLVVKGLTRQTIRRFGFRQALWISSAIMAISVALCAAFTPATPYIVMLAVLTVCGMARSVLFTGMSSLTFADIPPREMGQASVIWNMTQQVTNAAAVSLAALAIHISVALHGNNGLSLADCRWGLLLTAAIGLGATFSMLRLAPDAGSEVSGHTPRR